MPDDTQAGSGALDGQQTPSGAPMVPASGGTQPVPGATDPVSNPEAKRYADEAAAERTARKKLEAELKKFQDAQLSDAQKRERDFAEMQTKNLEYEARFQRQSLEIAGLRLAPKLGIADPAAALALVQAEHGHEVKFSDATGLPENLEALLKQVVEAHPVLAAQPQQQSRAPSSGGATNPGRQASGAGQSGGALSPEIIANMSNRERMANLDAIKAWAESNPAAAREWAERERSR